MMKGLFRYLSVLILILMGVSAVTRAAILSKSNTKFFLNRLSEPISTNSLVAPSFIQPTCKVDIPVNAVICGYTATRSGDSFTIANTANNHGRNAGGFITDKGFKKLMVH